MKKQLADIINGIVSGSEYTLIELVIRGEKNNKILEVFVDGIKPVGIDSLAGLGREIDETLEGSEEFRFAKITVSSPGVDREIKFAWQLQKHIGRKLSFLTETGEQFSGKLKSVNDNGDLELQKDFKKKKGKEPQGSDVIKVNFKDIKSPKVLIGF